MKGHNKKASPNNIQGQGKTPAIIKMARITKTFHPITTTPSPPRHAPGGKPTGRFAI
jgi:hypothetical protein